MISQMVAHSGSFISAVVAFLLSDVVIVFVVLILLIIIVRLLKSLIA